MEKMPASIIDANNERNQQMIESYGDRTALEVSDKIKEIMGKFGRGEINEEEFLDAKQEVIESVNHCFKTASEGMKDKKEEQFDARGI